VPLGLLCDQRDIGSIRMAITSTSDFAEGISLADKAFHVLETLPNGRRR
jgi:hypothetical protein